MTIKTQTSMLAMAMAIATCPALAAKPVDGAGLPFGNGFPSGEHYNLNIIGKKAASSARSVRSTSVATLSMAT